jgi:hypothetical protein
MPQDYVHASYALVTFENGQANVDLRSAAFDVQVVAKDMQEQDHPMWPKVMELLKTAGA